MFSLLVKVEVERAKSHDKYVHLRFCYNNKYWQKKENDNSIVAVSNKPEEDITKPSCTLFEPSLMYFVRYFTHAQTGWRVMMNNSTGAFYLDDNSFGAALRFVDWETLVKLPKHVAFLGDNGKYLKAYGGHDGINYLQFGSDDPNDVLSGHQVSLMRDGHVRIKSDLWGSFWRRASDWIQVDSDEPTAKTLSSGRSELVII
ncbi:uncharacterized protein LOC125203481 [Salvia hispanica]|uniref:uncharacterized protein LOC125203481 n=1 Tax=Salvia hispanica TaxID=49212 RepID=UPI00200914BC|nr:uncharacterized protein LOC125203481 [Salvia hispanica]